MWTLSKETFTPSNNAPTGLVLNVQLLVICLKLKFSRYSLLKLNYPMQEYAIATEMIKFGYSMHDWSVVTAFKIISL